ncbi:MAG: 1-deoxy-D-xylulose-5-phosphate synthase, partial [Bacteroidales bacterium]
LVRILNQLKDMKGPKLLHIRTKKGKGFKPAEESATEWHAPGCFNKKTGERIILPTTGQPPLFQDVFGKTLVELARKNQKIVGITPAMPTGCSMTYMMKEFPSRSFDVGIAEEHAVTFSGGLAAEGMVPFCNIYSSFMQRAYDQVIHDVAIQKLNVVFCLDRAGLVGEDGPTHHGVFDLAYFRCIPNMTVASPINEHWLRKLMFTAQQAEQGPFMIRYPRGRGVLPEWECPLEAIPVGKGYCLKEGTDIAVLTLGPIGNNAIQAIESAEKQGLSIAHYDMVFLKPLDEELLHTIFKRFSRIITIEDGVLKGGFGSAVLEFMADHGYNAKVKRLGIPDQFIEHGSVKQQYELCGIDIEHIKTALNTNW